MSFSVKERSKMRHLLLYILVFSMMLSMAACAYKQESNTPDPILAEKPSAQPAAKEPQGTSIKEPVVIAPQAETKAQVKEGIAIKTPKPATKIQTLTPTGLALLKGTWKIDLAKSKELNAISSVLQQNVTELSLIFAGDKTMKLFWPGGLTAERNIILVSQKESVFTLKTGTVDEFTCTLLPSGGMIMQQHGVKLFFSRVK